MYKKTSNLRIRWHSRRWIRLLAGLGTICLFGFGMTAFWVGGKLVAPANRVVGTPPRSWPIKPVIIPSPSGSSLAAWSLEHPQASATVVLFHPIRADRRSMLTRAALLYEAGYSSLLVDLQAHGESPGNAITFGHLERYDARAAVEFARSQHPTQKVAVIGWSLGGAATLLAAPLSIDALVIESVYPTINEAAHNRVSARLGVLSSVVTPVLLSQLDPRLGIKSDELRPIDHIDEVGCPVLVLSGDQDTHTTIEEAQRLFRAAKEPRRMEIFTGAAHCDLFRYDSELYASSVVGFLNETLGSRFSHQTNTR